MTLGNSKRLKLMRYAFSALLIAPCFSAHAQEQRAKIPRIGFLASGSPQSPNLEAFRGGLRELGYIEGKSILVEYRFIEGKSDRVPKLVAELLQLKLDVFVSSSAPAIRAAKETTSTIPVVMLVAGDPIALGLVDSLARPGGNITGLTRFTRELSAKRLELFKEVIP